MLRLNLHRQTPANNCAIGIVLALAPLWLDAVLSVEFIHRVEPRT